MYKENHSSQRRSSRSEVLFQPVGCSNTLHRVGYTCVTLCVLRNKGTLAQQLEPKAGGGGSVREIKRRYGKRKELRTGDTEGGRRSIRGWWWWQHSTYDMFTETKMTTQTALATSPAMLASNEEKINRHARTHFRSGRRGVEACSTPRAGGRTTTTCTKRCLSQCCTSWAHWCENTWRFEREREGEENENKGHWRYRNTDQTRSEEGGDTSAQTLSDRFTLVATSSLQ